MNPRKRYRVDGAEVTRYQIAERLGIKPSTVTKRLRQTPQPWTWATLKREKYRPERMLYHIDGKGYTIEQVAKELDITVHAARGRIYERLEVSAKLSWVSLRLAQRGRTALRRLLTNHPAAQMIRDKLNEQQKTVTMLSRLLGFKHNTYMQRVCIGEAPLTPEMASRVADALMFTDAEESRLHHLGAIQAGWKIRKDMVQRTDG